MPHPLISKKVTDSQRNEESLQLLGTTEILRLAAATPIKPTHPLQFEIPAAT
jgi:hypothetical protein